MPPDGARREGGNRALRPMLLGGLFLAELLALVTAFQLGVSLECRLTDVEAACRALRGSALRAFCLAAALAVYLAARPGARARFMTMATARRRIAPWLAVHVLGLVAIFLPLLIMPDEELNSRFAGILPWLAAGAATAAAGAIFLLAAPRDWAGWLMAEPRSLFVLAGAAFLLPDVVSLIQPLWNWAPLAQATFVAVWLVLSLVASDVMVWPAGGIVGLSEFRVNIAPQCSGIEGFVLMTAFLALYAALFREQLRMGRYWMVLLPLALFASWIFNVLRIAGLILIGAWVSPELALNGFHSFAGWLAFTLLALLVLVGVDRATWLQKAGDAAVAAGPPLSEDDVAARILPFVAFMLSSLVVLTFFAIPAHGFPLQAAAMLAALVWLRRPLGTLLAGRPALTAWGAGVAVGAGWALTAPSSAAGTPALADVGYTAAALWVAVRLAGTILLVPVVEELFFRGYLLERLDRGGAVWRTVAIVASTAGFAMLHDRWVAGAFAGLVFALVYLRRRRLSDAVASHVAANAVVAFAAVLRDDWSMI